MTIWIGSLLVMLLVIMLGGGKEASRVMSNAQIPEDLGEFVRDTLSHSMSRFSRTAGILKPHIDRVTQVFVVVGRKGHDTFIDRVFGRTNATPGRASSFFLKNIAEHKAEARKEDDAKNGY